MAEIIEGGFNVPMPGFVRVKQLFAKAEASINIETTMKNMFYDARFSRIKPGSNIAVAVGSRGINDIDKIVGSCIQHLKNIGANPFIVPAMGSHGGATANGQVEVLKSYGITSETMGVPIRSSMEVDIIGTVNGDIPIYMDKEALNSDGIIVINRIKPHTGFSGDYESGLLKMMAVGLGKHLGATTYHGIGFDKFAKNLSQIGQLIIDTVPIIGGIAIVENAYHQMVDLEFIGTEELLPREKELLERAKGLMPRILVNDIDVLIVNDFGKDISGPGMDPNVTGRPVSPYARTSGLINVNKLVVLNITPASEGNANGIGAADMTTKKFVDKINLGHTYANSITSTFINSAKIPMYMNNDFEAIQVALKTCNGVKHPDSRVVWIKDTLHLDEIFVSEAFLPEINQSTLLQVMDKPKPMQFDKDGNLSYPYY